MMLKLYMQVYDRDDDTTLKSVVTYPPEGYTNITAVQLDVPDKYGEIVTTILDVDELIEVVEILKTAREKAKR